MPLHRFDYGIEYIVKVPGNGDWVQDMLIQNQIMRPCRAHNDSIAIISSFYMINALRNSPYKFFDSLVREYDSGEDVYTILRPLDECELVEVENALVCHKPRYFDTWPPSVLYDQNRSVASVIEQVLDFLANKGVQIEEHGWYKVRLLA